MTGSKAGRNARAPVDAKKKKAKAGKGLKARVGKVTTRPSSRSLSPCFMLETNNGGRLENVPAFDVARVLTEGMGSEVVERPFNHQSYRPASRLEYPEIQNDPLRDDRTLVTNTTEVPWRCICQLFIEGMHSQLLLGSGWFAGPNVIVTAGHNIVSPTTAARARQIHVFPGRRGDVAPFGHHVATNFAAHPQWQNSKNPNFDYGVILLDQPVGTRVGWFGMSALPDVRLETMIVNNAGYASDKPNGTMWFNAGRIVDAQSHMLLYGLDTQRGQSGSPIFFKDAREGRYSVAVHAYGAVDTNRGIRMTQPVISDILRWSRLG